MSEQPPSSTCSTSKVRIRTSTTSIVVVIVVVGSTTAAVVVVVVCKQQCMVKHESSMMVNSLMRPCQITYYTSHSQQCINSQKLNKP